MNERDAEGFMLPNAQWLRLQRMRNERHFLLDVRASNSSGGDSKSLLTVSGSTGNVYAITIDAASRQICCNCPDDERNQRAAADDDDQDGGIVCKHICFLIYRVFRSAFRPQFFIDNLARQFDAADITAFQRRVAHLQRVSLDSTACATLTSPTYRKRYKSMLEPAPPSSPSADEKEQEQEQDDPATEFGLVDVSKCEAKDLDDSCGICCEALADTPRQDQLVRCGECCKLTHKECITIWIQNSKSDTCVYCRAWLPYAAYQTQQQQQQHSSATSSVRKRRHVNAYLNVARDDTAVTAGADDDDE
jgi:hypothetical protein